MNPDQRPQDNDSRTLEHRHVVADQGPVEHALSAEDIQEAASIHANLTIFVPRSQSWWRVQEAFTQGAEWALRGGGRP